jgi:hypothetical protein
MRRTAGLRCTICNHPARPQIDLAIATGLSKRAVAERFGVSRDAVWRHAQAHLTAEMRAALATKLLQREGDTRRILLEEGAGVTEALKAIRGPLFGQFLAAVAILQQVLSYNCYNTMYTRIVNLLSRTAINPSQIAGLPTIR